MEKQGGSEPSGSSAIEKERPDVFCWWVNLDPGRMLTTREPAADNTEFFPVSQRLRRKVLVPDAPFLRRIVAMVQNQILSSLV